MIEMVERVARAIFLKLHPNDAWSDDPNGGDGRHTTARHLARAAIVAMRWPTDAMALAGVTSAWVDIDEGHADQIWNAMIDAALKD